MKKVTKKRRRKINKKRTFFLLSILLILIALVFGLFFYYFNYIRLPKDLMSDNKNALKIVDISKDKAIVVYYPNDIEKASEKANEIFDNLANIELTDQKNHLLADYTLTNVGSKYVQVVYDISYNGELNHKTSYLFDNTTNEIVDRNLFKPEIYECLSNSIRYEMKMNHPDDDYYYKTEFALNTEKENLKIDSYYFDDSNVYVSDNRYDVVCSLNLNDYAGYIDLDLGIASNNKVIDRKNHYVNPNRKMIAFTFDDGPHNKYTNEIINELKKYDATATFYMQGWRVKSEESKNTVINVINSGSDIGSHSYSHKDLTKLTGDELEYQTYELSRIIESISNNEYKIKTFRVPYGKFNKAVKEYVGYPLIQWNIDPEDWKVRDTDTIISRVKNSVADGGIIVMHDIYETSKDALMNLIPYLIDEGYQLVTVQEMYAAHNIALDAHNVYNGIN